ncbi:MAG: cobalt ECF transporter T component CbiQ [Elusimicrobia bacterium RIFOXYA2_FULL_39_19]|nr:MAG: cobalt ECF transporter T component CbiQ [Elusimicrobia bacterium RIFOXYA2_FULL_39_19]
MDHHLLEKYNTLESTIHKLDPRTKILFSLLYVLTVVFTVPGDIVKLGALLLVIVSVIIMAKIPLIYVFKRSLVIFPFVFIIAMFLPFFSVADGSGFIELKVLGLNLSRKGLYIFWNSLFKAWFAIMAMILLSSTTSFPLMLKGLALLKVPFILIMILSFMYRYIFVLIDKAQKLNRAVKLRHFSLNNFKQIKIIANMIGLLFIMTYEKGERIYQSMVSRGFEGNIKLMDRLKIKAVDIVFSVVVLTVLLFINLWSFL